MQIKKDIVTDTIEALEHSNCRYDFTFFQAVREVLESIVPLLESDEKYMKYSIVKRMVVPDREFKFKVAWLDDQGEIQVNNGYRVQFNNVLGPYKGGLRFHPSVNAGILKFLAFEQIFKNALTGLPIGGGKGGSDFDPKGKSDMEIMKFCSSYMRELHKYIGPRVDVPAGDIGVGAREIGFLFGEYKRVTSRYDGILTGKPYEFGGSILRPEATGYGVVYFAGEMLRIESKESLAGKLCSISGSGNVAIYTMEKLYAFGAVPVTCSDSRGAIYDQRGIDLGLLKEIKLNRRGSLEEYKESHKEAVYVKKEDYPEGGHFVWTIPVYAAFPSATQNELTKTDAKALIEGGAQAVFEGANMPSTTEAVDLFLEHRILFGPAKAANAGGVAVSEFEMSQNASLQRWSKEAVDKKLHERMRHIANTISKTANVYCEPHNYVDGANIAGFKRVADAMIAQGI
jgi:glutamate dehydrogenase (NADP+)